MEKKYSTLPIKKILLPFIFILSFSGFGHSQDWWHSVSTGIVGDYGVLAEASYNGELYVGGWYYLSGGVATNNISRWNGSGWDSVGSGITGGASNVDVLCVYNGKLYAGGQFFAAGDLATNNIASWDGSHWDTLGSGLKYCGGDGLGWADAMAVYNGKLYVGGAFCHAGGIAANNIACWDGTQWDSVSSGINDSVYALAVYNGNLYAAGQFTRAGNQTVNNIAYWDGTKWNACGTGTNEPVLALSTYNNALYAGGAFTSAGGNSANYIARWNGTKWSAVGAGLTGFGEVDAFCVFNGMLYTGGAFTKSGTLIVNNIASWNGTAWDTVSTEGINNTVTALAVFDSTVFAGGIFSRAGKTDAADIASWNEIGLGINQVADPNTNVLVCPNPSNGIFNVLVNSKLPLPNEMQIAVYNMLGEKIYSIINISNSMFTINMSSRPAGIYLYRITNESGALINEGKIVIQ